MWQGFIWHSKGNPWGISTESKRDSLKEPARYLDQISQDLHGDPQETLQGISKGWSNHTLEWHDDDTWKEYLRDLWGTLKWISKRYLRHLERILMCTLKGSLILGTSKVSLEVLRITKESRETFRFLNEMSPSELQGISNVITKDSEWFLG